MKGTAIGMLGVISFFVLFGIWIFYFATEDVQNMFFGTIAVLLAMFVFSLSLRMLFKALTIAPDENGNYPMFLSPRGFQNPNLAGVDKSHRNDAYVIWQGTNFRASQSPKMVEAMQPQQQPQLAANVPEATASSMVLDAILRDQERWIPESSNS